ncbi:MAG TPA: class I SAM-dependent methyltransferase [Planctomycetota bacterium]|nr:class I SAM-dependent methyltransferase [Planctomycetota bacterium]
MKLTIGTGKSAVVENCQVCESPDLEQILFLGYLPPVNTMPKIGSNPSEQPAYPAMVLRCRKCQLVQLGLVVDPKILFPPEYPYTSGTTKILRENFAELYRESAPLLDLKKDDLIVDVGSNDGTLLSNFATNHRVHGIEPSDQGKLAISRGIPTHIAFFGMESAAKVKEIAGPAKVITATNVFAHIEDVHSVMKAILHLLKDDGVFISESHYLHALIETLQYDTIYHEHLRHYSLSSLKYLLEMHGLQVIHAKRIPTHGGSIRVYATRPGKHKIQPTVAQILAEEQKFNLDTDSYKAFKQRVVMSKLQLHATMLDIKKKGQRIYGIGAPSRASTLINYVGIDAGIMDCVLEVPGSYKIGKYIPGTVIPVLDETRLFEDQPEYAMLLSWHIADELIPKLKAKGFKGAFIVPLPEPRIVR